jgi:regulator of PEP synthase PpsR (kinase-PPPase family)
MKEAISQAQLTVTVHRLRVLHEERLKDVQKELDKKYSTEKKELQKEVSELKSLLDSTVEEQKEPLSRGDTEH